MKIALITDGIWPYVMGGMQKHSYYLCKYLAQKDVEIDLYHINRQKKYDIKSLEFFTEEEKRKINSIVVPTVPSTDKLPGHYIRTSKKQSEAIYDSFKDKSKNIDLIYTKGLAGWKFMYEKQKGEKLPYISLKVHGYEMYQRAPSIRVKLEHLLLRPSFKYMNQKADYIFSYGGKITDIITQTLKIPNRKVFEIPTGIGEDWITNNTNLRVNSPRQFVFLGRYERRKGIEELTNVLKTLVKSYDFKFHFIGPIPEKNMVVSEKIKYHGLVSDKSTIQDILQKSDVLVTPSYSEGMPNVIMEGMASGCAVIATDVGAVNIEVNDQNGWLIQPANKIELKNAIIDACELESDRLLLKKKNSVKKITENFLWTVIAEKHIEVFLKIIR